MRSRREGAFLVRPDQPRIPRHIGGEDQDETAGGGHHSTPAGFAQALEHVEPVILGKTEPRQAAAGMHIKKITPDTTVIALGQRVLRFLDATKLAAAPQRASGKLGVIGK